MKWQYRAGLIICGLTLSGPPTLQAQAETKQTEQAIAANMIEDFKLDNGLEIVVIPDRRAPVVTHMIWYKVGSADEAPGKSGIAHFFEHLMFKGTKNEPAGAFSTAVAEIGGSENAFTSYDYTAYFQQVAPEALETMMRFEADRMRNLILTDEVIGPERDVVLEERRMRVDNQPSALLGEDIQATLFQNHPYRIPVIGWEQEIEALNRTDALAFYDAFYAPNNAVLIVAGDVDAKEVRRLAEETYGKIPAGRPLPPRIRPQEPAQNAERTATLKDPRITVPNYQRAWVVPSYADKKKGEAEALDLLAEIIGGGARSRLYQALVVEQGVATSVGAYYQGTAVDPNNFMIYGTPGAGKQIADLQTAIDAEIARLARDGVDAKELEQAKNRFVRSMIFARDNQSGMARIYGSALATGETVKDVEDWPDRIRAVTAEQVQRAAADYLNEKPSVRGYLLPQGEDKS